MKKSNLKLNQAFLTELFNNKWSLLIKAYIMLFAAKKQAKTQRKKHYIILKNYIRSFFVDYNLYSWERIQTMKVISNNKKDNKFFFQKAEEGK